MAHVVDTANNLWDIVVWPTIFSNPMLGVILLWFLYVAKSYWTVREIIANYNGTLDGTYASKKGYVKTGPLSNPK